MGKRSHKGFIVIRHSMLSKISQRQVEEVLMRDFEEHYILRFQHIEVHTANGHLIQRSEIGEVHWGIESSHQKELYHKKLLPIIEAYPDYEIVYFGAAPIPLAMHLGYLIGNWNKVWIYLKRHTGERDWYGNEQEPMTEPIWHQETHQNPQEEATQDAIIRVSSSYEVNEKLANEGMMKPIISHSHIYTDPIVLDLPSSHYVYTLGDAFGQCLKELTTVLTKQGTVHVFAAIPVGLAFYMGTKIQGNVHSPIQTYQYSSKGVFRQVSAILLGGKEETAFELSTEEQVKVSSLKKKFGSEIWEYIQGFVKDIAESKRGKRKRKGKWYKPLVGEKTKTKALEHFLWEGLPWIHDTPLHGCGFVEVKRIEGGFKFFKEWGKWGVDAELVHHIASKFNYSEAETFRALRLLVFHESMHYWTHGLFDVTFRGVGRFPRIVETADYQADVWAMLHEYAYSRKYYPELTNDENPSYYFAILINAAIETMWAFDAKERDLQQMRIRRMNRYLVWYWQLMRMEDLRCNSWEKVLEVLGEKPVLEAKGLVPKAEGYRLFYRFDQYKESNLELGILYDNRIRRIGNLGYFQMPELIQMFQKRDHEGIKRVLRGAYASL